MCHFYSYLLPKQHGAVPETQLKDGLRRCTVSMTLQFFATGAFCQPDPCTNLMSLPVSVQNCHLWVGSVGGEGHLCRRRPRRGRGPSRRRRRRSRDLHVALGSMHI